MARRGARSAGVYHQKPASTVQNVTTMARAYWHFPVDSRAWWPFVSAGLSCSHNTVKGEYTPSGGASGRSRRPGLESRPRRPFKLGPDVMNDIELRYVDLGAPNWGLPGGQDIGTGSPGGFASVDLTFTLPYML